MSLQDYSELSNLDLISLIEEQRKKIKDLELSLNNEKTFVSTIMETVRSLVIVLDNSANILFFNKACEEVSGYKSEEVLGKNFINFLILPDDREYVSSVFRNLDETGLPSRAENYWITKSGEKKFLLWDNNTIKNENGMIVQIIGTGLDITDRVRQEREIIEAKEVYALAIDAGNLGLWDWEIATGKAEFNERWFGLLGYSSDEFPQSYQTFRKLLHPSDFESLEKSIQNHFEGKTPRFEAQFRMKSKSGDWIWIQSNGKVISRDKNGKPERAIGIHQDLTAKKSIEERLLLIADGLSIPTGPNFFKSVVVNLGLTLNADYILISRLDEDRPGWVKTVALFAKGSIAGNISYELKGTPCSDVMDRDVCSYTNNVAKLYPDDFLLEQMKIEAYVGTSLFDSTGKSMGVLVALYENPITDVKNIEYTLQIYALRISSEIERKEAEDKLIQERDLLASIMDTAATAITVLDSEGKLIFVNKNTEKVLGIKMEDALVRKFNSPEWKATDLDGGAWHPENQPFSVIMKTGEPVSNIRHAIQWPDGTVKYLSINGSPIKNNKNEIEKIVFNILDITGTLVAEREIRNREEKYRALIENAADAIVVLDVSIGRYIEVNPAAEKLYGYSREELLKMGPISPELSPLYQPDKRLSSEKGIEMIENTIRGDSPEFEWVHLNAKKEEVYCEIKLIRLPDKEKPLVRGSIVDISEKRKSQQIIKDSEERYRIIAEQTGQMVYDLNIATNAIKWAGAIEKVTGCTLDEYKEISFDKWAELIHPEDREFVNFEFDKAIKSRTMFTCEYRYKHKDDSYRYLFDNGIFLLNENNEPYRMLGAMEDITNRKKAEDALKESEETLRFALDAAKMGTWKWDMIQDKLSWSENVYKLFDIEVSEFNGTFDNYLSLVYENDREMIVEEVKKNADSSFNNDYLVTHRILRKDGNIHWLEANGKVHRLASGEPFLMIGTLVDVTDRKNAEEDLKASEWRFETFYRFANEAIIIVNPDTGIIVDTNLAFEYLYGYQNEESIGMPFKKLFTSSSWQSTNDLFSSVSPDKVVDMVGVKRNQAIFPAAAKMRYYYDKGKEFHAISIVDMTSYREVEQLKVINKEMAIKNEMIERQKQELELAFENLKRTQAQLVQSEKMAALGQLVAGIAHEINNPIGAIQASSQNLYDCLNQSRVLFPEVRELFYKMNENDQNLFQIFIEKGIQNKEQLTGMDQRRRKKQLAASLQEMNLSPYLSEIIVDIGIQPDELMVYYPLLSHAESEKILDYAVQEIFSYRNINTIQLAVEKASKIIYALKNFSHFDSNVKKTKCSLEKNIETVLTIYHNQIKKSIELVREYETIPDMYAYPDDLLHLWTNLIYNSLQAMNFSGVLKIGLKKENGNAVVSIQDSGVGIPLEIIDRIFEPFFTTKPPGEGSGLGLDIAKKIIDKHGGRVEVVSSPGNTLFKVFLPLE